MKSKENIIVVTGDSKGLGHEICKALLKKTNYLIVGLSRTQSQEVISLATDFPNRYFHFSCDLSDTSSLPDIYKTKIKPLGAVYGFISNAAMAYDDIISNLSMEKLEHMYKVNVFSPMLLTKIFIRDMLLNKTKGSILHISSISAHTGYKGLAMYASSKGAIEAFSKNTAREWGEIGIRSNCICPGFMETEMSASLDQKTKDRIYNRTSLKQPTSLTSVAETAVFLNSEDAHSITGQIFFVDSGTI